MTTMSRFLFPNLVDYPRFYRYKGLAWRCLLEDSLKIRFKLSGRCWEPSLEDFELSIPLEGEPKKWRWLASALVGDNGEKALWGNIRVITAGNILIVDGVVDDLNCVQALSDKQGWIATINPGLRGETKLIKYSFPRAIFSGWLR